MDSQKAALMLSGRYDLVEAWSLRPLQLSVIHAIRRLAPNGGIAGVHQVADDLFTSRAAIRRIIAGMPTYVARCGDDCLFLTALGKKAVLDHA